MMNLPRVSGVLLLSVMAARVCVAADAPGVTRPVTETEKKGLEFLLTKQGEDGGWVSQAGPAVTAMVIRALLQAGHTVDEPAITKGLAFIDKLHKPDGGWYEQSIATYNTSITLSTISRLPEPLRSKYQSQIADAQKFLKSIQSGGTAGAKDDKGKDVTPDHPWYGGWGYAQGGVVKAGTRPDLSNTQFVIAALRDSGLPASDPAIQAGLVFVSRTQATAENPQPWAKGRDDGGFIYSMRWNEKHQFYGESEGPDTKDRDGNDVLTAYGSMTYAGLKSFMYADISKEDPRVKAALRWIGGNYTLELNPGLNNPQGLYYYYHTFAAALRAYGTDTVKDAKGVAHDWRKDLEEKTKAVQKPDGSFLNTADRWMESNPVLVTTYTVLALQEARR